MEADGDRGSLLDANQRSGVLPVVGIHHERAAADRPPDWRCREVQRVAVAERDRRSRLRHRQSRDVESRVRQPWADGRPSIGPGHHRHSGRHRRHPARVPCCHPLHSRHAGASPPCRRCQRSRVARAPSWQRAAPAQRRRRPAIGRPAIGRAGSLGSPAVIELLPTVVLEIRARRETAHHDRQAQCLAGGPCSAETTTMNLL